MFCTLVCSLLVSLCCWCSADDSETVQLEVMLNWTTAVNVAVEIISGDSLLGNWWSRSGWFSVHCDANKCLCDVDVFNPPAQIPRHARHRKRPVDIHNKHNDILILHPFIYQLSHFHRPCHVAFAIGHASVCQSHYVWVGWTCLNPPKQEK